MKITKIIAAFMVAGFIGIAGCDTTNTNDEEPTLSPDSPEEMDLEIPAEEPTDEPTEEPTEEPAEEPAEETEG